MEDMSSEIEDNNTSGVSGSDIPSDEVKKMPRDMNDDLRRGFEDDRNDVDADSTRSSSPFLSNTEIANKEQFSPIASSYNEEDSISRRVQDMDTSIASLQESMVGINLNENHKTEHSNIPDESFQNSTMDTTRYNETQAQFDRDLDLDQNISDSKTTTSTKYKNGLSPWKQLRSSSTATSSRIGDIPKLHFNKPNLFNNDTRQSVIPDNTAVSKINELNKQVTGYRIQIKLFKQFLQHLIDKTRYNNNDNVFDISELNHFQNNLNGLSPLKSNGLLSQEKANTELDDKLSQNYDELLKLNEDLYVNLEDFQDKLHDKEIQLHKAYEYVDNCSLMINEILKLLISDPSTDKSSRQALIKCLDSESDSFKSPKPLEEKLYVVRLELYKRMDNKNHSYPSPPPSNPEKEQVELSSYINIIQELIVSLDTLQREFSTHKKSTSKLQYDLKQEVESTQTIKANYESLYKKFDQLCATLEKSKPENADDEIQKLRNENQKLRSINNTVDKKFNEYQKVIDKLQQEVNDFQAHHNNNSIGETSEWLKSFNDGLHHKDLLQSHKEVNQLQEQLNNLTGRYGKLQDESSNTISTLTNQLHSKKQENLSLGANQRVMEQLKNDLEMAVEKQRILKAEKIRLSYGLEALTNDNVSLQSTIRSLTDKITSLTVEAPQYKKEEISETTLKKLNVLEYQLSDLLLRDVHEFQKFLKSFIKIADDSSLKDPRRKIDTLSKKIVQERDLDSNDKLTLWDISELNTIREYHKSVFDYFARAVDIIVNDHVKLLLKESEHTSQTSEYVNKLHNRIDELNNVNDTLTRQLDTYYPDDSHSDITQNTSTTSISSKMRIIELTNRWKAEREARVYENQEAQKRLQELETENARLRQEFDQIS